MEEVAEVEVQGVKVEVHEVKKISSSEVEVAEVEAVE